jgi:hypothetical protein
MASYKESSCYVPGQDSSQVSSKVSAKASQKVDSNKEKSQSVIFILIVRDRYFIVPFVWSLFATKLVIFQVLVILSFVCEM